MDRSNGRAARIKASIGSYHYLRLIFLGATTTWWFAPESQILLCVQDEQEMGPGRRVFQRWDGHVCASWQLLVASFVFPTLALECANTGDTRMILMIGWSRFQAVNGG